MKHNVLHRGLSHGRRPSQVPARVSVRSVSQRVGYHTAYAHSNFWIPPLNLVKSKGQQQLDSNELLVKAGYLRQAYAGIYHLLPLGLRVQSKIEALIDKHMSSLRASKLSLSSISSEELWQQSGRLSTGSELFKFRDRKDTRFLLSPTHEEEITSLIGGLVSSYRDLPIRVYQVGRKYRDEKRPRGGLLRGREFIMKDLYTFDVNDEVARKTYDSVRGAYRNFFDELKVDYIEAQADSGNMGGTLSHEYHLQSDKGEDNILCCSNCDFARNEELVDSVDYAHEHLDLGELSGGTSPGIHMNELLAVSPDRKVLVKAYSQDETAQLINPHAVKAALNGMSDLDMGVEEPFNTFTATPRLGRKLYYVFDDSVTPTARAAQLIKDYDFIRSNALETIIISRNQASPNLFTITKKQTGDPCPACNAGQLTIKTAIEAGHTFHLGTRYSAKLGAKFALASGNESVPMVMGCHGIGVSRLIAATASCLSDAKGLNWPRAIAPFQVAIVPRASDSSLLEGASQIYEAITADGSSIDALIDDRAETPLPWRLNDADMIGYPVIIVLGRAWAEQRVEVQCRRLHVKETVDVSDVRAFVEDLLRQL
jgi:prolyl-tRNA synthetase